MSGTMKWKVLRDLGATDVKDVQEIKEAKEKWEEKSAEVKE